MEGNFGGVEKVVDTFHVGICNDEMSLVLKIIIMVFNLIISTFVM